MREPNKNVNSSKRALATFRHDTINYDEVSERLLKSWLFNDTTQRDTLGERRFRFCRVVVHGKRS